MGRTRGHQRAQWQVSTNEGTWIIRLRKRSNHNEQVTLSEEQPHLGQQSSSLKSDHASSTGQRATVFKWIRFRERWVNRELRNIWEENCYRRIECSTSNPLAALMWRWYLNSNFQPTAIIRDFRKVLMWQGSIPAISPTRGG